MKARGSIEAQLVIGIVVVAILAGAVYGVLHYLDKRDARNYKAGQDNVQAKWTAANLQAEHEAGIERQRVAKAVLEADNAKAAADTKATNADQRLQEMIRDARRKGRALASCDAPGDPQPSAIAVAGVGAGIRPPGSGVVDSRPAGPRFTGEFVRQYDSAWTGLDGEPVFEAADGGDGAAGSGTPWVTAEEVRDTHVENARRCSADRRGYASLIAKIKAAGAAVELGGAK